MSADQGIDSWLAGLGFGLPDARQQARRLLEEAQLTRPGKVRISDAKLPRAHDLLQEHFFLHCSRPECGLAATTSGRRPLLAQPSSACRRCGGSANRGAENQLVEACQARGIHRLVIVGGSPSVRRELESQLASDLELRMVDGTERRTTDRARADLEWADLVLIWGGSELNHKVSALYTQAGPHRRKVVHVARRGVAALLEAAVAHLTL